MAVAEVPLLVWLFGLVSDAAAFEESRHCFDGSLRRKWLWNQGVGQTFDFRHDPHTRSEQRRECPTWSRLVEAGLPASPHPRRIRKRVLELGLVKLEFTRSASRDPAMPPCPSEALDDLLDRART